jgi:hypothetical protein
MSIYTFQFKHLSKSQSNCIFSSSFDASSKAISTSDACEIKGPLSGSTTGGSLIFDLTGMGSTLQTNNPLSLYFKVCISNFESDNELNIQIDNNGGYKTIMTITHSDNDVEKMFFFSQTDNYLFGQTLNIKFELIGNIDENNFVYFENNFKYIPEAINHFGGSGIQCLGSLQYDTNTQISQNAFVGAIEIFDSITLPNNYLLCDGRRITTTENSGQYITLVSLLNPGNAYAYLPNLVDRHPLGIDGNASNAQFSAYNSDTANQTGTNQLSIDYFPSHSHNKSTNVRVQMTEFNGILNKIGNSITLDDTRYDHEVFKDGRDGNNMWAHNSNRNTHNHTIETAFQRVSRNTQFSTNFNVVINASNSTTDNTIRSDGNTTEEMHNYPLQLKSYKFIFGIRYK